MHLDQNSDRVEQTQPILSQYLLELQNARRLLMFFYVSFTLVRI